MRNVHQPMALPLDPESVKGFLDPQEGARLYQLAARTAPIGPCLEVGSYCGRSTLYLGAACKAHGQLVYAIDHHRGSEEHQRGEAYHDPTLYDVSVERMNTFPEFRRNVDRAGLADTVVPIVAGTRLAGRHWRTPLGMVFIDGGHSEAAALTDYRTWSPHLLPGGVLAIHDLFPDPKDGGQAPIHIYRLAMASGLFEPLETVGTLGALRRLDL
jgi:predicted O-methyltransferase YrrM